MNDDTGRVMLLRITLVGTTPPIWRMIEVPESYTFWDLHVAVQDAMGWLDYHLHSFLSRVPATGELIRIGIPDGPLDDGIVSGREVPMTRYLAQSGDVVRYEYDFGDGWLHTIELLAIQPKDASLTYPRCVDGARACPPEDCGGIERYHDLLEILADPKHPEHEDMNEWLKGHAKNYYPFDPDAFDPAAVAFRDPEVRWRMAFEDL